MLVSARHLLDDARAKGYAVGAFNIYNLEGVRAVIAAAQAERSPAILQLHPPSLQESGSMLIALCLAATREASVPMTVHLDHCTSIGNFELGLSAGLNSVMADGSHLPYHDNVAFTRSVVEMAHAKGATVEAELGRLSGTEDNLTVPEYEARLTDPEEAVQFVAQTGVDALAVCVGNVHGRYRGEPKLDFARLEAMQRAVPAALVLHGASGLPESMVRRSIELGVCKLNVNTEVREAHLEALRDSFATDTPPELIPVMRSAVKAMQDVVTQKLRLFRSSGQSRG